jgi:hypothetical protein
MGGTHVKNSPDSSGKTFRILKEKEIRQFTEYRTRRLFLEAWDKLGVKGWFATLKK